MTLSRPRITLYYDIVSPYSYAAFVILQRYAHWDVDLVLKVRRVSACSALR
jgi:2-hydroxychromene-2-carboxylate isomerase